ncbi:MAG: glycogen/starch synthase [Prevotellaceae bacterium]|nr:glycogen/starch synthase [Prevotellaceae bacterium]
MDLGSWEGQMPDFVFEASWEVCNKVGGIYTVLSTRAKVLQEAMGDRLVFIGPDVWKEKECPYFEQDNKLFPKWVTKAKKEGVLVRTGRWRIPGRPLVVLIDFEPYYAVRNEIYGAMWTEFQVNSLHSYGDYDEASMFAYGAGRVVESFYNHQLRRAGQRALFQAHEWMSGLGALYVRTHVPAIATVFTTHATSIGRSIAGNDKPLYDYLYAYNGNQMAQELNMEAKHSVERQTAHNVDCFTTVSDITAKECAQLLDCKCDAVLLNGFENDFVPEADDFPKARRKARRKMLSVANALTGSSFSDDTLIISTSGRYEYKNKGIDVFIDAMSRLQKGNSLRRDVLAFVMVPAWVSEPRPDLVGRLSSGREFHSPLENPVVTHNLHNMQSDTVLRALQWYNMHNQRDDRVKVIFVPCYLDGKDGVFNLSYYDLLIGNDLSVYPSYYEPWGYTPLESVAFHIPCITTSLSGFGLWANKEKGGVSHIEDGVEVIRRTDYNYHEVTDTVVRVIEEYISYAPLKCEKAREAACDLAQKALWENFIRHYFEAYDIALRNAAARVSDR